MVSQKKGNPSESVNLAGDTQRGLGETWDTTPVLISRYFAVRQRTAINVSQNHKYDACFFCGCMCGKFAHTTAKMRAFFCLFLGSK